MRLFRFEVSIQFYNFSISPGGRGWGGGGGGSVVCPKSAKFSKFSFGGDVNLGLFISEVPTIFISTYYVCGD